MSSLYYIGGRSLLAYVLNLYIYIYIVICTLRPLTGLYIMLFFFSFLYKRFSNHSLSDYTLFQPIIGVVFILGIAIGMFIFESRYILNKYSIIRAQEENNYDHWTHINFHFFITDWNFLHIQAKGDCLLYGLNFIIFCHSGDFHRSN